MSRAPREFQVFVKPIGPLCNLGCVYCYYLSKEDLYPKGEKFQMPPEVLEDYIKQHIEASPGPAVRFSWHGGEPTLLGLDYFRKIVEYQRKHRRPDTSIFNGIQTNGTLLNDEWCRFLAKEGFGAGISLDGPREIHDRFRLTKDQKPTHEQALRGYRLLQKHNVNTDILCVVNAHNARLPLQVYRFFKQIKAKNITFLPLVEPRPDAKRGVSDISVSAEDWGKFLCTIFDEWVTSDIGHVNVQIFEEATRTAFNQEHSLCTFRPTCGDIPVLEHNGDLYSCDHFVDPEHRIGSIKETPLLDLLESPTQNAFGRAKLEALPRYCKECNVKSMCNGECPKNRFITTPDGEKGLNYLCEGYKRFFTHCQPFISEVAALWRQQTK